MTDKLISPAEAARLAAAANQAEPPAPLPDYVTGKIGCSPEPAIQGVRISVSSPFGRTEFTLDRAQAQAHCAHVQACLASTATATTPAAAAALAIDKANTGAAS